MSIQFPSWLPGLRGRFLVFDGPDGSGKSTQFRRFSGLCAAAGLHVCEVREPGSTRMGEEIRHLVLDQKKTDGIEVDGTCEMLLFMAARAQLVAEKIRPALLRGELVLADRFIASTLAYQGTAGGTPIEDILAIGKVALKGCWPDLTVVFDVDAQTADQRMNPLLRGKEFSHAKDRIESKGMAFHRRVRQGYLEQAKIAPDKYLVVDASKEPDVVFAELVGRLGERMG